MNKTIREHTKNLLKENLLLLNTDQQLVFKRMYCHKNLELSVEECVDQMPDEKLDWALTQVEATIEKNNLTQH